MDATKIGLAGWMRRSVSDKYLHLFDALGMSVCGKYELNSDHDRLKPEDGTSRPGECGSCVRLAVMRRLIERRKK